MIIGHAIYLKNMELEEFKSKMCDRCKVTNVLLAQGEAEELCEECPLNRLEHLGKLGIRMNETAEGRNPAMDVKAPSLPCKESDGI